MRLRTAALLALIGLLLLTVLLAVDFIRDSLTFASGALALIHVLRSGIYLLASLGLTVFLYVFHKNQSQ